MYIVRVMATRAPVAQNKPHVDHAAVTWFCFSHESRTEAAIRVVYCTGQGNTLLIAAPAQNNIQPPSGPSHLRSAVLPASSPGKPPAFWHLSGLAHLFAAIDMDGPNCSALSDSKYMLKTYCNVSVTWSW